MTKKEKEQETREIMEAVRVLKMAISNMAKRKAQRYEQEFLLQVRDMINEEIDINGYIKENSAEFTSNKIKEELLR